MAKNPVIDFQTGDAAAWRAKPARQELVSA
jgi:hypothetical protein